MMCAYIYMYVMCAHMVCAYTMYTNCEALGLQRERLIRAFVRAWFVCIYIYAYSCTRIYVYL